MANSPLVIQFPFQVPWIPEGSKLVDYRWTKELSKLKNVPTDGSSSYAHMILFQGPDAQKQANPDTGWLYFALDTGYIYYSAAGAWNILVDGSGGSGLGVVLTGAVLKSAGTSLTTLAPVFTGGHYGSSTQTPVLTVNNAGQITGITLEYITTPPPTPGGVAGQLQFNSGGTTIGGTGGISYNGVNQSLTFSNPLPTFNNLSPLTTKGDLLTHDIPNNVRLPVGTDGQALIADSAATPGLQWQNVVNGLTAGTNITLSSGTGNVTVNAVPSGSDTQVQFNSAGVFSGSGALTWTPNTLTLGDGTNIELTTLKFLADGGDFGWLAIAGSDQPFPGAMYLTAPKGIWLDSYGVGTPGQVLTSQGYGAEPNWTTVTASPAGSDTQIQFNNAGVFGASPDLTFGGYGAALNIGATGSINSGIYLGNAGSHAGASLYYSSGLTGFVANNSFIIQTGWSGTPSAFSVADQPTGNNYLTIQPTGEWDIGPLADPGTAGYVLTSAGPGAQVTWSPAGGSGSPQTPTEITSGQTFTVNALSQVLFAEPITVDAGGSLVIDGTLVQVATTGGGGSGTPAGSDTQLQFNQAGSFGASSNLAFDYTNNILNFGNGLYIEGDFSTFANRPRVKSSTGANTYFEVIAPSTASGGRAGVILRGSSDIANSDVAGMSIVEGASPGTGYPVIFWGDRVSNVNGNPTNALIFGGNVSGVYAQISPVTTGGWGIAGNELLRYNDLSGGYTAGDLAIVSGGANNLVLKSQQSVILASNSSGNDFEFDVFGAIQLTGNSGTAGQALLSAGTGAASYWGTVASVAGSDTWVQFNEAGATGASGDFVFNYIATPPYLVVGGVYGSGAVDFGGGGSSVGGSPANITLTSGGHTFALLAAGDIQLNGSSGTSGQTLTSQGPGTPPIWASTASVAGSTSQVQFNNSGAFAADPGFTFTNAAGLLTLTVGGAAGTHLYVDGSNGGLSATSGGIVTLEPGAGNPLFVTTADTVGADSGALTLATGNVFSSAGHTSGSVEISGGNNVGAGGAAGAVSIQAGECVDVGGTGSAGTIQITGGQGVGVAGGNTILQGGQSTTVPGSVIISTALNVNQLTVDHSGAIGLGPLTNFGSTGQVLTSQGSGTQVAWGYPAPVFTLATLPTPTAGLMITVSDANSGAGALCYSDGSTWKDAGTHATVV